MIIVDLAVVLSILLTLVGSLLNLRWVRWGNTLFLIGILVLLVRVTYLLLHLNALPRFVAVQAIFIASLCMVWATATLHALLLGEGENVGSVFLVAAHSFYVLVLLAILIGSGTLHAVLIDACVIALVGISVASRGRRPHGLGRFVAAVLLPASLLIHTSSVVGAELGGGGLRIISLFGYAVLAVAVPAHPWFLRVITERDDVFMVASAVSVVYLGYLGLILGLSEVVEDVALWAFSMLGFVTLFYASAHAFARRDLSGCVAYYVSATAGLLLSFTSVLMLFSVDTAVLAAAILGAGSVMFVPAILPSVTRQAGLEVGHTLTFARPPVLTLLLVSGAFPSVSLLGRALLAAMLSSLQGSASVPTLGLLVLSVVMMSAAVTNSLKFRVMRSRVALTLPLLVNASLTLILFCVLLWSLLGSLSLSAVQLMLWLLLIGFVSGFSAWLTAWHEVLGSFLGRAFTHLPSAVVGLERRFRFVAERVVELLEIVETEERFLATLSLLVLLVATVAVVLLGGVVP